MGATSFLFIKRHLAVLLPISIHMRPRVMMLLRRRHEILRFNPRPGGGLSHLRFYIWEKSQNERANRPAVVTLFERLFLCNGITNPRTVILIRCHHPINHVFDRYRYPAVPATARGTWNNIPWGMRSAHLRPTGWRHPLLCDVSGRILFQKVVWRISVISAGLSLNLAQEFVVQSLCAIKWDLRGTEAAKRVWVWTIEYDCNVFYFIFTFSFAT